MRGPNKNTKYEEKLCVDCHTSLEVGINIRQSQWDVAGYICETCLQKRGQERYENNKEKMREQQRKHAYKNKLIVMEQYGNKCVCCEESRIEFLTIDHIKNNGAKEREKTKQGTGEKMYRWLIKNNFPKENYQILCFNCNCSKGFHGYCPHELEKIKKDAS